MEKLPSNNYNIVVDNDIQTVLQVYLSAWSDILTI